MFCALVITVKRSVYQLYQLYLCIIFTISRRLLGVSPSDPRRSSIPGPYWGTFVLGPLIYPTPGKNPASACGLNCHANAMVVFYKFCRTARSLRVHRTESVSVMGHSCMVGGREFHRVKARQQQQNTTMFVEFIYRLADETFRS